MNETSFKVALTDKRWKAVKDWDGSRAEDPLWGDASEADRKTAQARGYKNRREATLDALECRPNFVVLA